MAVKIRIFPRASRELVPGILTCLWKCKWRLEIPENAQKYSFYCGLSVCKNTNKRFCF